jgi:hypothetical protein
MHRVRLACYYCAKVFHVDKPTADSVLKSRRVLCVHCVRFGAPSAVPQTQPAPTLAPPSHPQ